LILGAPEGPLIADARDLRSLGIAETVGGGATVTPIVA
jgi:hypothetical protein